MTIRLTADGDAVSIDVEAGGRLSSLVACGRERLVTEGATDAILPEVMWGSFLMAPFAGRIMDGRVRFDGERAELPRNYGSHAIHGVVYDVPWQVEHVDDGRAELSVAFDPGRWPFRGSVRQTILLTPGRLELEASIVALDPMPAALGWHPWFRRDDGDIRLLVRSDHVLATMPDLIPTGQLLAVHDPTDLRSGSLLGNRALDHTYVEVTSPVVITWPDLEVEVAFEPPIETVVVHTPARGICVEPQTAWPDAARLHAQGVRGTGVAILGAGEALSGRMVWTWRPR